MMRCTYHQLEGALHMGSNGELHKWARVVYMGSGSNMCTWVAVAGYANGQQQQYVQVGAGTSVHGARFIVLTHTHTHTLGTVKQEQRKKGG